MTNQPLPPRQCQTCQWWGLLLGDNTLLRRPNELHATCNRSGATRRTWFGWWVRVKTGRYDSCDRHAFIPERVR